MCGDLNELVCVCLCHGWYYTWIGVDGNIERKFSISPVNYYGWYTIGSVWV
jgi:hypothetical protein